MGMVETRASVANKLSRRATSLPFFAAANAALGISVMQIEWKRQPADDE
jgi:hypothetical protein